MNVNIHCWNGGFSNNYLDYDLGTQSIVWIRFISELPGIRKARVDFKVNPNLVRLAVI